MGRGAQWVEGHNGSRGTMKNDISLARILLTTACPGSPALWAGSFTYYEIIIFRIDSVEAMGSITGPFSV